MPCTEAYKEHIEYTFNAFCRVVIHYKCDKKAKTVYWEKRLRKE